MFDAKGFLLNLFIILCSCSASSDIPKNPDSDFELPCSRWDSQITVCQDYIETEPLTGHVKIWYYEDDLYYGTTLFVCGADLALSTGNAIGDLVAESQTKNELLCVDAVANDLEWGVSHDSETSINVSWENLYLEINIPECPYDEKICVVKSYGYISI